jgi:uncharacterized protein YgiM (DUF1202 family)
MARHLSVTHLLAASAVGLWLLSIFSACAPTAEVLDSEALVGAPEIASASEALSGSLPVGSSLRATASVNLRSGPSKSYSILHVVPDGSLVTVASSGPKNGYYHVKHNGSVGWCFGAYLAKAANPGQAPSDDAARMAAIGRAKSGVGFSYWWGHGRYRPEGPKAATHGSCSGSCPNCSHGGSYGADCSGYVAKAWVVPASNDNLTVDEHPYSTMDFANNTSQWKTVPRANAKVADAFVYNSAGHGHIFLYASGDGWGSMDAYECKGCVAGCVHNLRSASAAYHAIRHAGW